MEWENRRDWRLSIYLRDIVTVARIVPTLVGWLSWATNDNKEDVDALKLDYLLIVMTNGFRICISLCKRVKKLFYEDM